VVKAHAQKQLIDSLDRTTALAQKLKIIKAIVDQNVNEPKVSLKYAKLGESISRAPEYFAENNSFIRSKGIAYVFQQKLDSAIIMFNQALFNAKKKQDPVIIAKCETMFGFMHGEKAEYDKAISAYLKSLKILEKTTEYRSIGNANHNIAIYLLRLDRDNEALNYAETAIAYLLKHNSKPNQELLNAYNTKGVALVSSKKYSEAIETYNKSIEMATNLGGNANGLSNGYTNLANVYLKIDSSRAEIIPLQHKALKALNGRTDRTSLRGLASTNMNIGILLKRKGDNIGSLTYLEEALKYSKLINDKDYLRKVYLNLSECTGNLKDFETAYEYGYLNRKYTDSVRSETIEKSISAERVKFETEKKEAEIVLLNTKNQLQKADLDKSKLQILNDELELKERKILLESQSLTLKNQTLELNAKEVVVQNTKLENDKNIQKVKYLDIENQLNKANIKAKNWFLRLLALAFLVSAILGYLLYNRRKLQQEAKLSQEVAKQQELATQAVLEAEERERKRISSDLHDGVGQTIMALKMSLLGILDFLEFKNEKSQKVFENALLLANDSAKEVRTISHQMMPHALLKKGLSAALQEFIDKVELDNLKINLSIQNLGQNLDSQQESVLYRVIQEAVNNVVKHAKASKLDISLTKTGSAIEASIEDNGLGFEPTGKEFEGIGLKNIQDRVAFLKGKVSINSQKGKGTKLAITIPLA
jgi:two-component system, NarL family, sensor kinase